MLPNTGKRNLNPTRQADTIYLPRGMKSWVDLGAGCISKWQQELQQQQQQQQGDCSPYCTNKYKFKYKYK